jgi:hypothetical protein
LSGDAVKVAKKAKRPNPNRSRLSPELTPRESAVRKFFLSKENVCPFGREAVERGAVAFLEVSAFAPQEQLFEALKKFVADERCEALVVVGPADPEDHTTGRIECCTLNVELAIAMDRIAQPQMTQDQISAAWGPVRARIVSGASEAEPISPLIGGGRLEQQLYAIAMGPQFGKHHPRYAPHVSVVAIGAGALEKSAEAKPRIANRIRTKVQVRLKKLGLLSGDPDAPRLLVSDEFYNIGARGVSVADFDAHTQARMQAMVEAHRARKS